MKKSLESSLLFFTIGIAVVVAVYYMFGGGRRVEGYAGFFGGKSPAETEEFQMALLQKWYGGQERGPFSTSAVAALPERQRLLINSQVFASRYAGYTGPMREGVFPTDPFEIASLTYKTGFRLVIIELAMEPDHVTPKLVAIDGQGIYGEVGGAEKQRGYLKKYIEGLMDVHKSRSSDPLILYVHFHSLPPVGTEPKNFIAFTGAVSKALEPAAPYLLRESPTGTYARQGQESKLFFTQVKDLGVRPVIVMTNVDTTPYRKAAELGLGPVKPEADLDLKVHVRVYGEGDTLKGKPAAFAAPASYWLATPERMVADAQARTKETFSIVFPVAPAELSKAQVNTLYNVYGVHAIAYPMFDEMASFLWGPESPHRKSAWLAKPQLLRYVPPEPILIAEASPKTNSGGGRVQAPKL